MGSELITGLFGAVGALIGAGTTLTANMITARGQKRLAHDSRKERAADIRRDACAVYLTSVEGFLDRCRELVTALDEDSSGEARERAHEAYLAEWNDLLRSCAPVVIAGPSALGGKAMTLRQAIASLSDECDRWYASYAAGSTRARWAKYHEARSIVDEAHDAFIATAQACVS